MTIRMVCICGTTDGKIDPNCERCRLFFLVRAVDDMRAAQRQFFRDPRSRDVLEHAKKCERIVDKALERLLEIQPELFDSNES